MFLHHFSMRKNYTYIVYIFFKLKYFAYKRNYLNILYLIIFNSLHLRETCSLLLIEFFICIGIAGTLILFIHVSQIRTIKFCTFLVGPCIFYYAVFVFLSLSHSIHFLRRLLIFAGSFQSLTRQSTATIPLFALPLCIALPRSSTTKSRK